MKTNKFLRHKATDNRVALSQGTLVISPRVLPYTSTITTT